MQHYEVDTGYGALEWSSSQMAFHYRDTDTTKSEGWDTVVDRIPFDVAGEFISFLNNNWKRREQLSITEIKEMYDLWLLTEGGKNG